MQAGAEVQGEGQDSDGPANRGDERQPPSEVPKDKAQRNFTDLESRIMETNDGFIQGCNTQVAVNAEHQVIVNCDLTNQGSGCPHLPLLVDQINGQY